MVTKHQLKQDISIVLVIISLPLLTYIYKFFPETKTTEIFGYHYNSRYYNDILTFVWTLMQKLVFVLTFFVWYVTCKHWWRNILVVPMVFFTSQTIIVLNDDLYFVDENEVFYSFIIALPLVIIFILFFSKLEKYYKFVLLNKSLNMDVNELLKEISSFDVEQFHMIRKQYEDLCRSKEKLSNKDYLNRLIYIQDQLLTIKSA